MHGICSQSRFRLCPPGAARVARVLLFVYALLLLSPCAMALSHDPAAAAGHAEPCHHGAEAHADGACLSQPAIDCSGPALVNGGHDNFNPQPFLQLVTLVDIPVIGAPTDIIADAGYFSRAPPPGAPALNVRHCVYLK